MNCIIKLETHFILIKAMQKMESKATKAEREKRVEELLVDVIIKKFSIIL
jgi:hypothetical protein